MYVGWDEEEGILKVYRISGWLYILDIMKLLYLLYCYSCSLVLVSAVRVSLDFEKTLLMEKLPS